MSRAAITVGVFTGILLFLLYGWMRLSSAAVFLAVAAPQVSGPVDDWTSRSTASGVVLATRFDTQAEVDDYVLNDAQADHVTYQTATPSPASGNGYLQFEIEPTDTANSGNWRRTWAPTYGEGDSFYVQYRVQISTALLEHVAEVSSGSGGFKTSIISISDFSAANFEHVINNGSNRGHVYGYHQDGSGFPGWEVSSNNACSATDFQHQPAINGGVYAVSGYTACQNAQAQLGSLYSYGSPSPTLLGDPPNGSASSQGFPSPYSRGVKWIPDTWMTVLQYVSIGAFGSSHANNCSKVWVAKQDAPYRLIYDACNLTLGSEEPGTTDRYDTIWLLPYETARVSEPTRPTLYMYFDEVIVSTNYIPAPGYLNMPEWYADIGEWNVERIGTNSINDLNDCPADNCTWSGSEGISAVLDDWNGAVYAEDFSTLGAWIIPAAGGHAAYYGNELYVYDFDTRLWSKLAQRDPLVLGTTYLSAGNVLISDGVTYGEISAGNIASCHTYAAPVYVPASAAGNTRGQVVIGLTTSPHNVGGQGAGYAHAYDLDVTGNTWWRSSTGALSLGGSCQSSWAVFDTDNELVWTSCDSNSNYGSLAVSNEGQAVAWTSYGSKTVVNVDTTATYVPEPYGIMLMAENYSVATNGLLGYDVQNPTSNLVVLTESNEPSTDLYAGGIEWWSQETVVIGWGRDQSDRQEVYICTPPSAATWDTGTWAWGTKALAGDTISAGVNGTYTKFRRINSLPGAFAVAQSTAEDGIYVFRLGDPDEI